MENSDFCLVGLFLTTRIVHFPTMRSIMANICHPVKGIQILDMGGKRYLFRFYHKMDMNRVIIGAHWTFNNHLLIFHKLLAGEDLT